MGIFALIVITTAYLQAFVWEYKYQDSQKERNIISYGYGIFRKDVERLIDENQKLKGDKLKKKL